MKIWKIATFALWAASSSAGQAESLQKVTIGVGTQVLNVTYPWLMMPKTLGYWADQGLDVTVVPVNGSLGAAQMLAAGTIDFAQMNAGAAIQTNAKTGLDLKLVMTNTPLDWSVVAPADSGIQTPADLEGKTVGMLSVGTAGNALLRSYLTENGVNPDGVAVVATGAGAPALLALQNGSVDALMFWASMNLTFENMGADLTYLFSEDWRKMPDFSLVARQSLINEDPEMVEKIVRGAVMGTAFAMASPDCTRLTHWQAYPDTKPGGAPDEATAAHWDDRALALTLSAIENVRTASGGSYWGAVPMEGLDLLQDYLVATDQIAASQPPENFVISVPEFFETVNDIDFDGIQADAQTCAVR